MGLKPIHDPEKGALRLVALMSGSGTNVRRILEHGESLENEEGGPLFQVVALFSDSAASKAPEIGRDFDIPVVIHDLQGWMQRRGVKRSDLKKREEFDIENVRLLKPFNAKVAIYGGYMSIASPSLVKAFIGVNVHPADLSVKTPEGGRKWTGAHAVRDAIQAGESHIRSSTHIVSDKVDMGPLLMVSAPVEVEAPEGSDLSDPDTLERVADRNQERLKERGDWKIFPGTIEAIARGWFQLDQNGDVFYKGEPVPDGLQP